MIKKNLIALAALTAITGVAQAQSSVTMYGVADAFVGQRVDRSENGRRVTNTVIDSNGMSTSRLGFRGVEDMGGGLKAIFTMEAGLAIDTGAANGSGGNFFSRQAFVGLNGGFGTVSLGRQYTAYDALRVATNNTFDSPTFSTTSQPAPNYNDATAIYASVWNNGVRDYSNRSSNSIAYTSPNFSGVSGAIVLGTGEDKILATATSPKSTASRNYSAHIKYANGPLVVGYAYQNEKFNLNGAANNITTAAPLPGGQVFTVAGPGTPFVGGPGTVKYNLVAGSYDFGVAKVMAGYNVATQRNPGIRDREFQMGLVVPVGPISLAAGYARSRSNAAGNPVGTGYSLLGTYSLSKRTNLYAGLADRKFSGPRFSSLNAATPNRNTVYGTGIRHTF